VLGVNVLLEDPLAAHFQPPGRGTQVFSYNLMVYGRVHDAIDRMGGKKRSNIKDPPPNPTVGMRLFSAYASFFRALFLFHLTIAPSSNPSVKCRFSNSRHLHLLAAVNKGFF
jgi:hypothetical protein